MISVVCKCVTEAKNIRMNMNSMLFISNHLREAITKVFRRKISKDRLTQTRLLISWAMKEKYLPNMKAGMTWRNELFMRSLVKSLSWWGSQWWDASHTRAYIITRSWYVAEYHFSPLTNCLSRCKLITYFVTHAK